MAATGSRSQRSERMATLGEQEETKRNENMSNLIGEAACQLMPICSINASSLIKAERLLYML